MNYSAPAVEPERRERRDSGPELNPLDPFEGLTSKQLLFAEFSFSGMSDVDAYRKAYDCAGMSDKTIGRAAHEVAHKPKVEAKLLQMRLERGKQSTLVPFLTREFVLNGVMQLALNSTKDSVRLAAYQTLGKTVGIDLFRETTIVEKRTRTVEDVDRELKERLAALAPMIEGSAKPVAAKEPDLGQRADRRRKPRR